MENLKLSWDFVTFERFIKSREGLSSWYCCIWSLEIFAFPWKKKKNLNKVKLGLALLKGWLVLIVWSLCVCVFYRIEDFERSWGFRCLLLKIIKVLNLCYELLYIYILKENGIIKCRALSKNSWMKINLKFHYFKKVSYERIIIVKKTFIDSICSTCRIIKFSQLLYQKYQFEGTKLPLFTNFNSKSPPH